MDNLARNAMLARQAGMSYGKWKAMQQQVKIAPKPVPVPEDWLVCKHCGKAFKPKTKRKQSYCDVVCQNRAYYENHKQMFIDSCAKYRKKQKEAAAMSQKA